jgi:amino acid permease
MTPDISAYIVNSYLIILKSLIPSVIASLYHDLTSPDTNPPEWALSGRMWISFLMVILVPLSFLRRLDSLRHTSYIALFSCGEYLLAHKLKSRAESLTRL